MNRLLLSGSVLQRSAPRSTPAGLPVLELVLKHESEVEQAGQPRKVSVEIKALAIGEITVLLMRLPLGSEARFAGFLASARNGRGWLFHVTEVEPVV
ncbi:MAG: primosomal replication protein N [Rubrivivax sp.]|nr:primosomal replication protein N [Rubrivivax sp.]